MLTLCSIANVEQAQGLNTNDKMFNLAGQRVGPSYRGIVKQNGKKYIKS